MFEYNKIFEGEFGRLFFFCSIIYNMSYYIFLLPAA